MIDADELLARVRELRDTETGEIPAPRPEQAAALAALIRPQK